MAATVPDVSKDTYARNQELLTSQRDHGYGVLVRQEAKCILNGVHNPGMFTAQIESILRKKNLIGEQTSMHPRMNEMHRTGMIVKVGTAVNGKNPVEVWRPSTKEEREVLALYRITDFPTISTSLEMMEVISWYIFTQKGKEAWEELPKKVKRVYLGMMWEASKVSSKDLTINEIRAYNGDIQKFMLDGCKRYLQTKTLSKEKSNKTNKNKDDLSDKLKKKMLKYRAKKVKAAKKEREAQKD